jgi:catechol 2,3-dioxygenase-like lactoylglutathione lyase family enzyme
VSGAAGPAFRQLNLVVTDMDAALAFWRRLGLTPRLTPDGQHADGELSPGLDIEWDTAELAPQWDTGTRGARPGGLIIGFQVASRAAVGALYEELTAAGYHGHQRPYDGFWGARHAIADDPDGNSAGLMSPVEADREFWPPTQAPAT